MQFEVGMIFEGKVSGLTKYGAFVDLPCGQTGMVHISEVSTSFVRDINTCLKKGQIVKVKVIGRNSEGKISLSMKAVEQKSDKNIKPKSNYKSNKKIENREQRHKKRDYRMPTAEYTNSKNRPASFEDMLSKFKQSSDEKISDLKKTAQAKRKSSSKRNTGSR